MQGVYKIVNTVNQKFYIGSSIEIENRWKGHLNSLYANHHRNWHLQRAFNKYGRDSFILEIIEIVNDNISKLREREQYWINTLDACNRNIAYNIAPKVDGSEKAEETRRKLSIINTGRKLSAVSIEKRTRTRRLHGGFHYPKHLQTPECRAKALKARKSKPNPLKGKPRPPHVIEALRKANLGRVVSAETREKLRQINLGKKHSEATKKLIAEQSRGRVKSPETRRKISENRRGKFHTQATKDRISAAKTGIAMSEENKTKISKALKGRPHSEEHNRKVSEALKASPNTNRGKKLPPEWVENIRKASTGRLQSEETKKRKSLIMLERGGIRIICIETGKIYNSINEASRDLSIDVRLIRPVLKGLREAAKGFTFKYLAAKQS